MASIDGAYNLVYEYVAADTADPWKVFALGAPAWVNDLGMLEYWRVYWINVTQPVTLYFPTGEANLAEIQSPIPPSTFYGTLVPGKGLTPAAGMMVTAWVNGA